MAKKADNAVVEQATATPVVEEDKEVEQAPGASAGESDEQAIPDGSETVNLVGTIGQKTGNHGVYADGHLIAEFKDGVSVVKKEVAKLLKELGLTE